MEHVVVLGALALAAVAGVVLTPAGRSTLGEVRRNGLMLSHARAFGHMMLAVALLAVAAAALNAR